MARGINDCNFLGYLGRDPETKIISSGDAVTNISIAIDESYKDKSGNKVEKTEWINATAFRKLAEIMQQYLRKGSLVHISGKMKTDKYQKDGIDKYSTKIIINNLVMLDGKPKDDVTGENKTTLPSPAKEPEATNDYDDDIPF